MGAKEMRHTRSDLSVNLDPGIGRDPGLGEFDTFVNGNSAEENVSDLEDIGTWGR